MDDFWWLERGIPPHVADEMPAVRAQWLKAAAQIVDESRTKPGVKANDQAEHERRLEEAKRKAGL